MYCIIFVTCSLPRRLPGEGRTEQTGTCQRGLEA